MMSWQEFVNLDLGSPEAVHDYVAVKLGRDSAPADVERLSGFVRRAWQVMHDLCEETSLGRLRPNSIALFSGLLSQIPVVYSVDCEPRALLEDKVRLSLSELRFGNHVSPQFLAFAEVGQGDATGSEARVALPFYFLKRPFATDAHHLAIMAILDVLNSVVCFWEYMLSVRADTTPPPDRCATCSQWFVPTKGPAGEGRLCGECRDDRAAGDAPNP